MARPLTGPTPKDRSVHLRTTEAGLAWIDAKRTGQMRGGQPMSRSELVREVLADAARRGWTPKEEK
jgi:hypothetical protein